MKNIIIKSTINVIIVILLFEFLEWIYAGKDRNLAISISMIFLYILYEIRDSIDTLKEKLDEISKRQY